MTHITVNNPNTDISIGFICVFCGATQAMPPAGLGGIYTTVCDECKIDLKEIILKNRFNRKSAVEESKVKKAYF